MVKIHTIQTLSIGHTETLEVKVTPEDIKKFAMLSGDYSTIHMDDVFARSRGYSSSVAHGMLIGGYISALVGTKLPGRDGLMQLCELQFREPLIPPDTLTIVGEVKNISYGTGQITLGITVKNIQGTLLATGMVKSILHPIQGDS